MIKKGDEVQLSVEYVEDHVQGNDSTYSRATSQDSLTNQYTKRCRNIQKSALTGTK